MAAAVEGSSSSAENQNWVAMKNWHDVQKEKERERRRMRDRERRQSMSQEERERHLARRRRNYQLRRERASSTVAPPPPPPPHIDLITNFHQDDEENFQAMVTYNEVPQLEYTNNDHERLLVASSPTTNPHGGIIEEGRAHVEYQYPKGLRFYQIRHLARLLNSPSYEVLGDDQHVGSQVTAKSCDAAAAANKCKLWTRIRLIDMKRLARGLNSAPKGLTKKTISALYSTCDKEE